MAFLNDLPPFETLVKFHAQMQCPVMSVEATFFTQNDYGHSYGRLFSVCDSHCETRCRARWSARIKPLSHCVHLNGRSPE